MHGVPPPIGACTIVRVRERVPALHDVEHGPYEPHCDRMQSCGHSAAVQVVLSVDALILQGTPPATAGISTVRLRLFVLVLAHGVVHGEYADHWLQTQSTGHVILLHTYIDTQ